MDFGDVDLAPSGDGRDNHRAELAAFLRAQRSRLRPTDVGLLQDYECRCSGAWFDSMFD